MKKYVIGFFVVLLAGMTVGCQKKHPVKVSVSPKMKKGEVATIAVFPFTSALNYSDDPDKVAPKTIEKFFFEALGQRSDYKFVTPNTVAYAVDRQGLGAKEEEFLKSWPMKQEPDVEFFKLLADLLKCDAFLIGTVDLWQKDEADYQENAYSATYVGATITILDAETGERLFQASDENYLESIGTETNDRRVILGASGKVFKDTGEKMFKAPPFEDVVHKVVRALVSSIPQR